MNAKNIRSFVLASLTLCASVSTSQAAFMTIDNTVDLYVLGMVSGTYDSNLFSVEDDPDSDYLFTISPGVEINVGRENNARLNLRYTEDIRLYTTHTDLNTNVSNIRLLGRYDMTKLRLQLVTVFNQRATNAPGTRSNNPSLRSDQVESFQLSNTFDAEYDLTEKIFLSSGVGVDWTKFTNNEDFNRAFSDRARYSLPFDVLYRVTPDWSVGAGYRFSRTNVDGNRNQDFNDTVSSTNTHNFNLSLRGDVLPKVNVNARVGYSVRTVGANTEASSSDTLSAQLTATWQATQKLSATVTAGHDFRTSSTGNTVLSRRASLGVTYNITERLVTNAAVGYTNTDFVDSSAEDHTIGASIEATYSFLRYLNASLQYAISNNSSDGPAGRDFTRHLVTTSVGVRY